MWIVQVVAWREWEDLWDSSFAVALWSAFGCEPKWAEELADLGLQWDPQAGRLLVDDRHRSSADVWPRLMNCVLYAHRFSQFSDSRWCTLGRCSRQFVFASLLGLDSLVHSVLRDPKASDYHLGGFRRKSPKVMHFLCLASLSSSPADGLLGELLKDDRLVLHLAEYKDCMRSEMQWLCDLPDGIYSVLAGLCDIDVTGHLLRSQVLQCAHISLGFVHERIWSAVDRYPWKLALGDRLKTVDDLRKLDAPPADEPLTRKVWYLAKEKFPDVQLAEALGMLAHIGWSSATVEQLHASAAQVKRRHHMYGLNSLISRALVHTARLFYAVKPVDKEISKLEQQLRSHLERQPAKVRASGIFMRQACELLSHRKSAASVHIKITEQQTHERLSSVQKRFKTLTPGHISKLQEAAHLDRADAGIYTPQPLTNIIFR